MTGQINLKVRNGFSKDARYKYYPYWYLEIIGDGNKKVNITPSFEQIRNLLIDIFNHEKMVDNSRNRIHDAPKWIKYLENTLEEIKEEIKNE